jgi:hypothetical protein
METPMNAIELIFTIAANLLCFLTVGAIAALAFL